MHIYLGSYGRFVADDFCSSAVAHSRGIIRAAFYWYTNWTGRYSANALDALFGYLGPPVTSYVTGAVVIIWFIVLAFTIVELISASYKREMRLLLGCIIAAMILFAVLEVIPLVGQSLYWGQGMRSVVPPLIVGTFYIGIVSKLSGLSTANKLNPVWLVIAALITFISAGFAETYFALQTSALVIALIFALASRHLVPTTKRTYRLLLVAGLAGSLAGGLLMFVAPGNKVRQKAFPPPPAPPELLTIAFRGLREFFALVVFSQGHWLIWIALAICAFIFGTGILQPSTPAPEKTRRRLLLFLWLPFATFVLLIACWVPMAWGTSLTLAHRTFIIPTYVFACLLTLWAYIGGRIWSAAHQPFAERISAVAAVLPLICLLGFGFITVYSSHKMWRSRSAFVAYAQSWDERDRQIQRARSQGMSYAIVRRLHNSAELDEIELDPKITWLTKCMQDYYGSAVIPELGDLENEPNGAAKQAEVERQFAAISIVPGGTPAELNQVYKTDRGKVGFYHSGLAPEQIKLYYQKELARLGWKYIGEKKIETPERPSGAAQNLFCNGEIAATLFITGPDKQRLGYTYSLALNWGMSSGYVWGAVDCPQ